MTLIAREATEEDIAKILDIANSNLLALNPSDIPMGEIEGHEFVRGFFDPAITRLTKLHVEDDWQSFITLNPDSSRKRFYLDIYTRPGARTLAPSLDLALELARKHDPAYRLWLGVQSNDFAYKSLLENHGFTILRKYWTLEMKLPIENESSSPSLGVIRELDLDKEDDLRIFHEVHQDAFSQHFGFMPRHFDEWSELVIRDKDEINLQAWLISVNGVPAGFVDFNDEQLHNDSGYVAGLGVRQAFQGRGLGEALLRHAIQINSELGRSKLCLSVDAGNESGALRLYEKVGMKPISEWHQYENLNWSK
jgi:ribosomal protein S18 acetylase RimI-like enzyme